MTQPGNAPKAKLSHLTTVDAACGSLRRTQSLRVAKAGCCPWIGTQILSQGQIQNEGESQLCAVPHLYLAFTKGRCGREGNTPSCIRSSIRSQSPQPALRWSESPAISPEGLWKSAKNKERLQVWNNGASTVLLWKKCCIRGHTSRGAARDFRPHEKISHWAPSPQATWTLGNCSDHISRTQLILSKLYITLLLQLSCLL